MINDGIKLLESLKQYQVSKVIEQVERKVFELIKSEYTSPQITPYFNDINTDGVPFSRYELEPANISQIKKLINALYHAKLAFKDIEKLDLKKIEINSNIAHNLYHLSDLNKIANNAYEASILATHLDVDLQDMFADEWNVILPFFHLLKDVYTKYTEYSAKVLPSAYSAGEIAGTAIDQIRPLDDDIDYNFLTQLSGNLPGYIHQLTQSIQQLSNHIKETEPKLNKDKLDEIQNAALNLLNDIENLSGDGMLLSLNYIYLIRNINTLSMIIRNILTLSMSSLEQIGEVSGETQDLIREKIAQLKYSILPALFGLVDSIEVNSMLKPGTLSTPLMKKVQALYQTLLFLPTKAIDFKAKGEELLSIEDSRFIDLRLALAYKRISTANKEKYRADQAQNALTKFYAILNKPQYQNYCINELPAETKKELVTHYKMFQSYMEKIDIELNVCLVKNLLSPETPSSYIGGAYRWLTGLQPTDHITRIIAKQKSVENLIIKCKNSQIFHINLNKALIKSVRKTEGLVLFPYNETTSVYHIDESKAFDTGQKPPLKLKIKNIDQHIIRNNFKRLCQLIQTQIKAGDIVLSTDQLDKTAKDECRTLFNKIRPYFIYIMSMAQKEDILKLELYLAAVLTNKRIQSQNVPSVELYSQITESGQQFLNNTLIEWRGKREAYYDLEQKVFLNAEESLKLRNEENKQLKFINVGTNKELQDPEKLSATQALTLSQWYAEKHHKYLTAQSVYQGFTHRLKKLDPNHSILDLMAFKPKAKEAYRTIYNIFQPYFVADAPAEHRALITKLDKYFVAVFSNREIATDEAPLISDFLKLESYIEERLATNIFNAHRKMQFYDTKAQNEFVTENQAAALKVTTNPRAHFLLKHTLYSQAVQEFRAAMSLMTARFNQSIQADLTPQATGIPFPEMEEPYKQLTQGKQTRAIKELYNSLYHVEEIILKLEQLNDSAQSFDIIDISKRKSYLMPLLTAYPHINELIKLSKRLVEDPYYGLIARELADKAQILYTSILKHSAAYHMGHEEIPTVEPVTLNPLWYILNAFYIAPKHIDALKKAGHLSIEKEYELHAAAKNATLDIQKIIQSSDSYLKLFMNTPGMISLYRELTNKLNEFATTVNENTFKSLDEIRPAVLTPMILEADLWENKLGLIPGTLAEPIRKITTEFFKGLLHPLNLHSKIHIGLICDPKPLEQRKNTIEEQIDKSQQRIKKIGLKYKEINELYWLIQDYKKSSQHVRRQLEHDLREQYKSTLPRLAKLKLNKTIPFNPKPAQEDCLLDAICNEGLAEYEPHFSGIEALITTSYHYALGLLETEQMFINTSAEQLTYLLELNRTQKTEDDLFIEQYTTESFTNQLEYIYKRHIGLQHAAKEYRPELEKFLLGFKEQIINQAKKTEDINLTVELLLKEKVSIFEKNRYAEYYHLDSVLVAINQFGNYFSQATTAIQHKNPLFENEATLKEKVPLIDKLESIANDKKLSIRDRLELIKTEVNKPKFKKIILKHPPTASLSFASLKLCLLSLLEALHLYTPTRKKLFNKMSDALNNPPEIHVLAKHFGLFAHNTRPRPEEPAANAAPEAASAIP